MNKIKINNADYWSDQNENKWSCKRYSKAEAEKLSKTLVNCKNCINCDKCEYCIDCRDCSICVGCVKCKDCDHSNDCINCQYCNGSKNCNRCFYSDEAINCIDCGDCPSCEDCKNCEYCESCIDCKECYKCKSCDKLKNEKNIDNTDYQYMERYEITSDYYDTGYVYDKPWADEFSKPGEHNMFTGIIDFNVSITNDKLIVELNSYSHKNYIINVPIVCKGLILDYSQEPDNHWYIADLIDTRLMIKILNENDIEYLYILDTKEYKAIDLWETVTYDKDYYIREYINETIRENEGFSEIFNTENIIDSLVIEYQHKMKTKTLYCEELDIDIVNYLFDKQKIIN